MSMIATVGNRLSVLAPTRKKVSSVVTESYVHSKQFANALAWRSFMNMAVRLIPDDLYDWQDPEFDRDPADQYSI